MRRVEFTIPYPPTEAGRKDWAKEYGLNAYRRGKRPDERAADARFWHELVRAQLYRQRVPKRPFEKPVKITFYWHDRLDIDNHAAMGKVIVDALRGWLLHNDGPRWYAACEHRFGGGDVIRVVMEEAET